MIVNSLTRQIMAQRKTRRDLAAAGYEHVDDKGGRLWELNRGGRSIRPHRIVDVVIDPGGQTLWVKIEPENAADRDDHA